MGPTPVAAGILLLASLAPFQCGSNEPDDATRIEETPGEALYQLAGEFEKAGDPLGRVRVLKHLVARYPEILGRRFPGSSLGWVRCLTEGRPPPSEPGLAWVDPRSGRLVQLRHRRPVADRP